MMKTFVILLLLIPLSVFAAAPDTPTDVMVDNTPNFVLDATFPAHIYDRNYGDWVFEVAIGNLMVMGNGWYDAPYDEVGSYPSARMCSDGPEDSGVMYCGVSPAEDWPMLVQRENSTGIVRLVLAKFGTVTGDSTDAMGGYPFYNSYDDTVYLIGNGSCIRKLADDGDGTHTVSLVAGDCSTQGHDNDTGASASFGTILGATADGAGNIWVADQYSSTNYLRKIVVSSGEVTTVSPTRTDGGTVAFSTLNTPNIQVNLSPGQTSEAIHIADIWTSSSTGWSAQVMDTSTGVMTRLTGVNVLTDPYERWKVSDNEYSGAKDGPAPDFTYLQESGRTQMYSPFYDSVYLVGQDQGKPQRYSYDTEWGTTVGHLLRPWKTSYIQYTDEDMYDAVTKLEESPLERSNQRTLSGFGVDRYGGIYTTPSGFRRKVYRIYNPTFGGLALEDVQ